MRRRNFLKNGLGIAGIIGAGGSNIFLDSAMAQSSPLAQANPPSPPPGLVLIEEIIDDEFNAGKHHVKIIRRKYKNKSKAIVELWAMNLDGLELPPNKFGRHNQTGCFYSQLLPFHDNECTARGLATAIVNGYDYKLYKF